MTAAVGAAPTDLIDQRLLFVTGKGGVGKTTISAALAIRAANHGRRVLVCEVDAKGTMAAAFEAGPLRFEPRPVHDGVAAMAMNTEDSLREYLRLYVRLPLVARLGPLARTFDFVADAAPGVKEILTVGKVCYEVRERHYDLVVVDAAASGHIAAQLSAPWSINDLVQVGLVRDQTRWMTEILADPDQTGVVVVTTPEELPVIETLELDRPARCRPSPCGPPRSWSTACCRSSSRTTRKRSSRTSVGALPCRRWRGSWRRRGRR